MSSVDKRIIEHPASTELYNDDWFIKDSVVEGTTKISGVNLKELLGADGTQALEEIANAIAEEYDSTHTYTYNSWVFHEGTLYRCISQSVTGTWDATKWQAKTIKEFIDTAKNSVLSTIEQMLGEYLPISTLDPPSIEAISKGDIFIYQRTNRYKFYRAKADHPQGVTEFDIDDWDEFDTVADLIEDVTENAGKVADVQVKTTGDYETVVENKIAKIDLSSITAYGEVPNLPQAIATFKDGADAPMKSLKVAIEPQQEGSGDPSPTNICPIIGWDECNVWVVGKNLWDRDNIRKGVYTNSDGTTQSGSASTNFSSQFIKVKPNTIYSITMFGESYENGSLFAIYYDENKNGINQVTNILRLVSNESKTFTPPSNAYYVVFTGYRSSGIDIYTTANIMVCEGTPTAYEPYNGHTYTIDLGGTRYGGKVDVVNGIVTPAPYYASYNGETLTGEWISDRDKYEIGATPTIGAQVVNIGASGTPVSILPTVVKSLRGVNNVFANTGDINDCVYRRDMNTTINDIIARLEALEG